MKRLCSFLFLLCAGSAFGASPTPTGVVSETNGAFSDVYISNVSVPVNGAYTNSGINWGFGANNSPTASSIIATLNSPGFNSSGTSNWTTRTVYGTHEVRQAYPNQTNIDASVNGSGIIMRIAQSEPVWSADGNISWTFPANWFSNNSSATVVGTNSSTLAYPVVIGQWDHIAGVCTADRVSADFPVAFNAAHGWGIACVRFDATGETSSATTNFIVSAPTLTKRVTGLVEEAYVATIPVSIFTAGETIDLRARAYPKYGDSTCVLDTDAHTDVSEECLGWNKSKVVYNSTITYAFVATNGNDGTASASTTMTTASNSPFLSIGKAVQNNATVIYLFDGVHPAVRTSPSSRVANNEWYVVQPCSTGSVSSVTVQITSTKAYKAHRLEYKNVTVGIADTSSWLDGENVSNSVRFANCTFNHGAVGKPTVGPNYQSYASYFENCLGDLSVSGWYLGLFSTVRIASQYDGCVMNEATASTAGFGGWYRVVSCLVTGPVAFIETSSSAASPRNDNLFIDGNYWSGYNSSINAEVIKVGLTVGITNGIAIRNNVVEVTTSAGPIMALAADTSSSTLNHLILWNNTVSGSRMNIGYNETGTSPLSRINWSVRNNLSEFMATKHDVFGTQNANRVGGWPVLYGVGWSGNVNACFNGLTGNIANFLHDFMGMNSFQPVVTYGTAEPSASPTTTNYMKFVSRTAWNGAAGSGGGNYRLLSTSPFMSGQLNTAPYLTADSDAEYRGGFDPSGAYASASPRKGAGFFQ